MPGIGLWPARPVRWRWALAGLLAASAGGAQPAPTVVLQQAAAELLAIDRLPAAEQTAACAQWREHWLATPRKAQQAVQLHLLAAGPLPPSLQNPPQALSMADVPAACGGARLVVSWPRPAVPPYAGPPARAWDGQPMPPLATPGRSPAALPVAQAAAVEPQRNGTPWMEGAAFLLLGAAALAWLGRRPQAAAPWTGAIALPAPLPPLDALNAARQQREQLLAGLRDQADALRQALQQRQSRRP